MILKNLHINIMGNNIANAMAANPKNKIYNDVINVNIPKSSSLSPHKSSYWLNHYFRRLF